MTDPSRINIRPAPEGSGTWQLEARQWLPASLERVFPFFAEPANLERLTPRWLRFQILTPMPLEMRTGALIDYRLKLHGLPIRWRTEISDWDPPKRFVDRQIRGPYRLWVHEHSFEEQAGGTLVLDRVTYRVPLSFLIHPLFVKRDLRRIFEYRCRQLVEEFGGETTA